MLIIVLYRHRQRGWRYVLVVTLFGFYVLAVVDALFFPILISDDWPANLNTTDILRTLRQVNWVPFHFDTPISSAAYPGANMRRLQWLDIIGNILLTIPFGAGMTYLNRKDFKHALLVGLGLGLLLEGMQLIVKLIVGGYYHTVDVNDVIWHALGFLLGYGIFTLGSHYVKKILPLKRGGQEGFSK